MSPFITFTRNLVSCNFESLNFDPTEKRKVLIINYKKVLIFIISKKRILLYMKQKEIRETIIERIGIKEFRISVELITITLFTLL